MIADRQLRRDVIRLVLRVVDDVARPETEEPAVFEHVATDGLAILLGIAQAAGNLDLIGHLPVEACEHRPAVDVVVPDLMVVDVGAVVGLVVRVGWVGSRNIRRHATHQ